MCAESVNVGAMDTHNSDSFPGSPRSVRSARAGHRNRRSPISARVPETERPPERITGVVEGLPCGCGSKEMVLSPALPADPATLAAALPDDARWVYARSLLLAGDAQVRSGVAGDAALVLDSTTAVLVGRPDPQLLGEALAGSPGRSLLVEEDALAGVRAALPDWIPRLFVVHMRRDPYPAGTRAAPGVVVSAPLDPAVLAGLPADVRADAEGASAAAVRIVDGVPVAVCAVSGLTETLWDVGIDTIEPARRKGHATAAFLALAAVMAAQGRQPVWAAYEDNPPSLALAARLGFRPVARMAELVPPGRGD